MDDAAHKVTVVVADDHGVIRDSVRWACDRHPDLELVGEAADGYSAGEVVERLQPDVAVLDVVLPGPDGLQVARDLKAHGYRGRILILTGSGGDDVVFDASVLGIDGFLRKTANLDELAEAIISVAAGRQVLRSDERQIVHDRLGEMARRARVASAAKSKLTAREREILELVVGGVSTRQISSRLGISVRTAESHIANLYRKLEVRTRVQAVRKAITLGLVSGLRIADPSGK